MRRDKKRTRSASDFDTMDDDGGAFRLGGRVLAGCTLGFLLIAVAGGWAATAQLSGAVIATGTVNVDQNLKAVQHRDGGIISEIAVEEGDFVIEGEILIRLDDVQTRAELAIVRAQLAEAYVRRARLVAERDGVEVLQASGITEATTEHLQALLAGEARLLEGNLRNRRSQKDQLNLGIEQLGEEIVGLEAQRAAKIDEIGLVQVEHQKMKGLVDKRLVEGSRAHTSERELRRMEGEKASIDAEIARAKARISEIKLQVIAIDEQARTEAQRELSVIDPKIAELNERRWAIEDRLSRTEIKAPISGTINELAVNTIGGVITPAETLVTIVPKDATLKIEARLAPTDIDQVYLGQSANLRFSTFNQRTTPELRGSIAFVSPATFADKATGQHYYLAEVEVSADELSKLDKKRLLPGMPVEVFMSTEPRTAISYLSKPFTDQFSRAFREQ
ncbi:MAG TPA: HlyD family type I secretion periplasmic adaptor subunit [Mesorhizobium sp.]|nr:HlyD family type I secretion periplasmic adaptor subunit [Mesorhizobium sp.]